MSKTESIHQVRDVANLIDLYAQRDANHDGKLEASELLPEDASQGNVPAFIHAHDQDGDGSLSPWEVMRIRHSIFQQPAILRMQSLEEAGRTFENIPSLPADTEIGGVTYKQGTQLRFHESGVVLEGVLAGRTTIASAGQREFPAGTRVIFNAAGELARALLSEPLVLQNGKEELTFPGSAEILIHESGWIHSARAPAEADILIADRHFREVELLTNEHGIASGVLAEETSFSSLPGFRLPAGSRVTFDAQGLPSAIHLAANLSLRGVTYRADTKLYLSDDRQTINAFGGIQAHGMVFSRADIRNDRVANGWLMENAVVQIAGRRWEFLAPHAIFFNEHGSVRQGILARHATSPYGSDIAYQRDDLVKFFDDGKLVESSRDCFRSRYPHISLTGVIPRLGERFGAVMQALESVPPDVRETIRGLHFYDDHSGRMANLEYADDEWGFVDRHNTIHINVDGGGFFSGAVVAHLQHEAAHAYTRAVANRDPNFLERWQRAAGGEEVYGAGLLPDGPNKVGVHWVRPDQFGNTEGSRRGCTTAYGCKNIFEDIAEHVELIWESPDAYRNLLDPTSMYYDRHPEEGRHLRAYRAKVLLLREYGFITEETFRRVVPPEGLPAQR